MRGGAWNRRRYSTLLALQAKDDLVGDGISAEVIDLRVLNPFNSTLIVESVRKTRRLLVVDGGWRTAGFSAEVITCVAEQMRGGDWLCLPRRLTFPDAPAPTSRVLENNYYPQVADVKSAVIHLMS